MILTYLLKQVCLETLGFWEQKSEVVGFGILHHMQKKQYYKGRSSGKRGRYWVKRAMLAHGDAIASGAQKIIDGE